MIKPSPFKELREKLCLNPYQTAKLIGVPQNVYERLEAAREGYRYGYYLFKLLKVAGVKSFKQVEAMFVVPPTKIIKSLQSTNKLK